MILTIEELHTAYIKERGIRLTLGQFTFLVEFFPAILVTLSDGFIDHKEKAYLDRLAQNLSHSFQEEGLGLKQITELQAIFKQEFEYLTQNLDTWQESYLNALAQHLKQYPENKDTIRDTILLFAQTSQDINEAENDMVDFLTRKLNLD
jgi:hypothetical protein